MGQDAERAADAAVDERGGSREKDTQCAHAVRGRLCEKAGAALGREDADTLSTGKRRTFRGAGKKNLARYPVDVIRKHT